MGIARSPLSIHSPTNSMEPRGPGATASMPLYAPSSEKPNTGMSVAPIEREEDPTFRKMHIDYKPVLFSGAVGRRGSKGSNTPSDILSPKGDEKRMASAGLANKRDAKGGKGAAAKGKR